MDNRPKINLDIYNGWINSVRNIESEIKNLTDECEELRECLGVQGIAYDKLTVKSTPENKLEKIMARIDLLERQIAALKIDKGVAICNITGALEKMEECPEKTVLYRFYIRRTPMSKIAKEIGYDRSYCYKLLKKGKRKLYEEANKRSFMVID